MRRGGVVWGGILILLGLLFLLDNLGILSVNVWQVFWPLLLIAAGLWVLYGVVAGPRALPTEEATIPLAGATAARIRLTHGAGKLVLSGGAPPDVLVSGTFAGGLDHREQRDGDTLAVEMRVASGAYRAGFFPLLWIPGRTLDWRVRLNGDVPLTLELDTGASASDINLTGLKVSQLRLSTGASATELEMPGNPGITRARVEAGVGALKITIPASVAARIELRTGLSSASVSSRFIRNGDIYESAAYDTAENRLELSVQAGVGSVEIR